MAHIDDKDDVNSLWNQRGNLPFLQLTVRLELFSRSKTRLRVLSTGFPIIIIFSETKFSRLRQTCRVFLLAWERASDEDCYEDLDGKMYFHQSCIRTSLSNKKMVVYRAITSAVYYMHRWLWDKPKSWRLASATW